MPELLFAFFPKACLPHRAGSREIHGTITIFLRHLLRQAMFARINKPLITKLLVTLCRLTLLMSPVVVHAAGQEDSLFDRLIISLEKAPQDQQAHFSSIALSRLAEAYLSEADLARQVEGKIDPTQIHWARSVEGYAYEITRLMKNVETGEVATITFVPRSPPTITVGDFRVMLTHPRPEQQSVFEHQILEDFCQRDNCEEIAASRDFTSADERTFSVNQSVKPAWEFTADGPACSYPGIRITFKSGTNFDVIRKQCKTLFQEVESLVDALSQQQQYGVLIDWSQFRIDTIPDSLQHAATLNFAGDTAVLNLPLLYENPDVMSALKPWLINRLSYRPIKLELQADQFGWDLGPHPD